MKITILDGYTLNPGDLSWREFERYGEVTAYHRTTPDTIVERCKDAEAILTNKVIITAEVMDSLPQLKYIGVLATGYNVVDIEAARERGIIVTNIPAYSTDSVVQMTFAHILNITNRIGHYARQNSTGLGTKDNNEGESTKDNNEGESTGRWSQSDDFCYWDTPLIELSGKTLGIVGLGNIGMKVARIGQQFGMDTFALTSKNRADLPDGIQKTTLEGLLSVSDILTLHCPLNEQTHHIINADTLTKMKHGAILINTGRGPLVDEQAVAEALRSGQLAGYGTDVLSTEPPTADNPILSAPNAFVTPHIAWATPEARTRLMKTAAENIEAFIAGKPQNVVNA